MTVYISRDDSYVLEHHGVKGMKWGVRKDKKRSERYKSLSSTNGDVIKKGSSLYRVSSNNKERNLGNTYTTVGRDEWKNYVDVVAFSSGKAYKYDFKATKDLFGPSEKERIDVFIEMAKDKKFRPSLEKAMRKATILPRTKRSIRKELDRLENKRLDKNTRQKLSFTLNADAKINSEYADRMKKKGYSIIADDFDRLSSAMDSPTATIVLDRDKNLSLIKIEKVI